MASNLEKVNAMATLTRIHTDNNIVISTTIRGEYISGNLEVSSSRIATAEALVYYRCSRRPLYECYHRTE